MSMQVSNSTQKDDRIVSKKQLQPQKTQIVIKLVDDKNNVRQAETFTCIDTDVNYLNNRGQNGIWERITGGVRNIVCRTQQEFKHWITNFEKLAGKNDRTIDKNDKKRFDAMQTEQESQDAVRIGDFEISDFGW